MDRLPDDKLLKFHPNSLVEIRKIYGFNNAEDLDKAIDIFDDWVKKQNHFVKKDFSREYLERGIIYGKGSVEVAKTRLEKLCTMRTLMPQYFEDYDFEKDFNLPNVIHVMLPKLTKAHGRIFWIRNESESVTSSFMLNIFRLCVVVAEYIRSRDYVNNITVVFDFRKMNLAALLMNCQINELHRFITIMLGGYGARLKGIHYIMPSKLIEGVLTMVKQVLSPKIRERIKVHKDVEELYEFVPKEIIPVEYGGEEKSLQKIYDEWVAELSSKNFKEHWREMCRACTDESCRQTDKFNEQYMGMPGTFRTLSVD